jgi:hypothetical protein
MKIKHTDIVIPIEDPFKNCKLDRKKYGEILTDIIDSYSDGFVLAIDSKWGTGKTTFVKMWKQQIENHDYKTLYFNAWANDFDSSPLVALLAELKTITAGKSDETFKSLLKKGAVITKKMVPGLVKAIAEKYIDTKVLNEVIGNLADSAVDILKDEVDEYTKKKKGLIEFRDELEKFVEQNTGGKPLVFIIDELDRCRPNYGVQVLEQVKHFFNVPGIIFVLAVDKLQLSNAIRGFYGSDLIDANEYLRRFIDIEYSIPEPVTGVFCKYLYGYYVFNEFFNSPKRSSFQELRNDNENFITIATKIFEMAKTTLRQQEKIFAHARLVLKLFELNNYVFPGTFFLLIFIRDSQRDFYDGIVNKTLTIQDVADKLTKLFPENIDPFDFNYFIDQEACFIRFYDNYYTEQTRISKLLKRDEQGNDILLIKSGFKNDDSDQQLLNALIYLKTTDRKSFNLGFLLKKIDLLDDVIK